MSYINTVTNQYPVTEREIKLEYPNVSFGRPFTPPAPYAEVVETDQPVYDRVSQAVKEVGPLLAGGVYTQQWEVVELEAKEIAERKSAEAERIRSEIMDGVQRYLDDFARTKTYDNILSACTYATSTVPRFAAEGQYCVQARDACWDVVANIEAEVMEGNRPAPSGFEDIRAELPALSWPA